MKEFIGSPGTVSGLVLRIGQCAFAAASIGIMASASGFSSYTAFCYLIASMGLQGLWSFGLACLDVYALRRKRDLQNPVLVSLFVVGDWCWCLWDQDPIIPPRLGLDEINAVDAWKGIKESSFKVTATLSLAAACSSAGVVVLYAKDLKICKSQINLPCNRFEISILFGFLTWLLISISSHVMFWILASV
ncbi:CASP-like protein 5B2 isoform X1 [Manihot esculenta]|uniref:Uncharacterized protein n=1 Tax=Manihot esculenta TaxID=3983 RepID=A0ACB7HAA7_MANES|nr:CASP-like protein 5B2 isoform X1 [Manihot esculenta]KAG8649362.1 hypothetical protein MANES_08G079700v8 [Manihot esculenta]